MKHKLVYCAVFLTLVASASVSTAQSVPVASDSRIKTFVYTDNDVFNLVTRYGYQTYVELEKNEEIDTISMGDKIGFQIMPYGNRIFIRPLLENAHTNMTVITTKRTYQFDLMSTATLSKSGEELAYVVRFFYPGDKKNQLSSVEMAPSPVVAPTPTLLDVAPAQDTSSQNYNYTFSGSEEIAPLKIYDDGKTTFFKLASVEPTTKIFMLDSAGNRQETAYRASGEYVTVGTVAPRFILSQSGAEVEIYNENAYQN